LKHIRLLTMPYMHKVAPRAGAWIETVEGRRHKWTLKKSPPARGRGLKHSRTRRISTT